jgi:hypothetical protein
MPDKKAVRKNRTDKFGPARQVNDDDFKIWGDRRGKNTVNVSYELSDGTNRTLWQKIRSGNRQCGIGEALKLSHLLAVPLAAIVNALGYPEGYPGAPVIGRVRTSAIMPLRPSDPKHAPNPSATGETINAILLDADGPLGFLPPQSVLYYQFSATEPLIEIAPGAVCFVETLTGVRYVGTVTRCNRDRDFTVMGLDGVQVYGPGPLRETWPLGWVRLQR